ncbi:MAG: hypothetical protein CMJ84_05135 [Planctomycetes bacterium]|nr:hypothetical protein [Planctomycetota bacterium]
MGRRVLRGVLVALLLGLLGASGGGTQEPESEVERYLRLAREGSAVVRPQAAQRLVALGAPAAERLLLECGGSPDELARLGRHLVEVLGEFSDVRLRERLWQALADPDFPWRPSAALALAAAPFPAERAAIGVLFGDPLAAVRAAAVAAAGSLEVAPDEPALNALLADPDARVRRAAAMLLYREGDGCALAWLLEELNRDDRFFEQPDGKLARYAAARLLGEALGDTFGYEAEYPLDDERNASAAEALEARFRAACGGELPAVGEIARAGARIEGAVIGLELRSCRRGEYFLRWSVADELFVGTGNAVMVQLPAGTVAGLLTASEACFAELGGRRLFGEPGCDIERFRFRPDPAGRSRAVVISKGQAAVEGLRPAALARLARLLVATLPTDGLDPRLSNLRARVEAALAAIGG